MKSSQFVAKSETSRGRAVKKNTTSANCRFDLDTWISGTLLGGTGADTFPFVSSQVDHVISDFDLDEDDATVFAAGLVAPDTSPAAGPLWC